MSVINIRFVRGKGIATDLIGYREGTCMPFTPSHAECVTPEGKWLGQHGFGGMQAREPGYDHDEVEIMADGRRCEIIVPLPVLQAQHDAFYAAAKASIGEPYDWSSILGYALPGHHHDKFHAICSAKMFLLLRKVNYFLWPIVVPAHEIDPRDLMLILSTHVEIPH
jgi:hypothetical protein